MNDIQLYQQILGVQSPWRVTDVRLNVRDNQVDVKVEHDPDIRATCPECGKAVTKYDHLVRRWRHLDTCQMQTIIECDVPRANCPTHGIHQMQVPWAEKNNHFTALFEAFVIMWLKQAHIKGVAERFCLSWDEVAHIQESAVKRGLARRKLDPVKHLAIDETSFQKRHQYVTILLDGEQNAVIDVLFDRKAETLQNWLEKRPANYWRRIECVTMDMWDPFIKAVTETIPNAKELICFDRFHIAQHFSRALDKVRAGEHRQLLQECGESMLKGTRFDWLKNAGNIDNRSRKEFLALTRSSLKTARAWQLKEMAAQLWDYVYRIAAEKGWLMLITRMMRSRMEEIKKVARMLKNYLWGILNAIMAKATNALAESKNSRVQWIKKMACGFRNIERMRMAILFHLGGLDMMPKGVKIA